MVKVQFKNCYSNKYEGKNYAYQDYKDAAVGDIVVVNTINGYAVAKVVEVNAFDFDRDESTLSTVAKVIITEKELMEKKKAEYERRLEMKNFVKSARKATLLNELKALKTDDNYEKLLNSLSNEELEKVYRMIKSC